MNSFFVPQLGSQIYTMAGMTTRLNLQADRPGTYPGLSAQFSGDGFSDMRFEVVAVPPADFARLDQRRRARKAARSTPQRMRSSRARAIGTLLAPSVR